MNEHEAAQEGVTETTPRHADTSDEMPTPSQHGHKYGEESAAAHWLEKGDTFIYALVGICFFMAALFTLGYAFYNFFHQLVTNPALVNGQLLSNTAPQNIAQAIINLVSDLLLVLIIMEVLSTVLHYLRARATSLTPFLFIGMISATRGVLAIGAKLSVTQVNGDEFREAMIELGVNAAVILALGITLRILSHHVTSDME